MNLELEQPKNVSELNRVLSHFIPGNTYLLNLVIDSGERDKLLEVIGAVVELDPLERQQLFELLRTAKLTNIIKTIKLLEDRFHVVAELKELIFNKSLETHESHIQKVIENHYWLFGEEYHLVTAEEPAFEEALRRYIYILRGEKAEIHIDHPDKRREMDIFAVRRDIQNDLINNIVVELKNPTIKLGGEQVTQVKDYMRVILKQELFNASNMHWTFYLVGNAFDTSGSIESDLENAKNHGERHLVYRTSNYKFYVKKWSEIFAEFELRHQFLYRRLKLEREKAISPNGSADDIVEDLEDNFAVQPAEMVIPDD